MKISREEIAKAIQHCEQELRGEKLTQNAINKEVKAIMKRINNLS
jgi:hypothetical protein